MPLFTKTTKTREEVMQPHHSLTQNHSKNAPQTHTTFWHTQKLKLKKKNWNSHTKKKRFVWLIVIYLTNLGSLLGVNMGTTYIECHGDSTSQLIFHSFSPPPVTLTKGVAKRSKKSGLTWRHFFLGGDVRMFHDLYIGCFIGILPLYFGILYTFHFFGDFPL